MPFHCMEVYPRDIGFVMTAGSTGGGAYFIDR
jgi:hypothetical protein